MRKSASIVLLVCFALYHFGYYGFYYSHQIQLEHTWHQQIYGTNTDDLQESILEIPLAAPYMANQEDFQPTNTRFEKDGNYYRAIKQRYQNDTLQIVYVPDTARQNLESTVQKWISWLTQDDFQTEKSSSSSNLKVFVKDYIESHLIDFVAFQKERIQSEIGFIFSTYTNPFSQVNSPPPQYS